MRATHEPHCPVPRAEARGETAHCLCPETTLDLDKKYAELQAKLDMSKLEEQGKFFQYVGYKIEELTIINIAMQGEMKRFVWPVALMYAIPGAAKEVWRCAKCGWPLKNDPKDGCTLTSCSQRNK